jgi:hypothetical protein
MSVFLEEKHIEELQNHWFSSGHSQTNPKDYDDIDEYDESIKLSNKVSKRKDDLVGLLRIIYDYLKIHPEPFKSGKQQNHLAFYKYLRNCIISNFPFKEFSQIDFDNIIDAEFSAWLKDVQIEKEARVSWLQPHIKYNKSDELGTITDYRYKWFLLLAKLCNYIDELQVRDYHNNEVLIQKIGKFKASTKALNGLVYGEKHILSAFLGQHILRQFPFKDYTGFKSEKFKKEEKKTYEHYTPMSFFRDLIWTKEFGQDYLFNKNSSPYSVEQWLSILWHNYRTIYIHDSENNDLNEKQKSRRKYNAYADPDINICVLKEQEQLWNELFSIENLKKVSIKNR